VSLYNPSRNGTADISAISITGSADFTIDWRETTCGATLRPGATCYIAINFDPSSKGSRDGTLIIKDNASNSPQAVELDGSGEDDDGR
jgi:hypothetical protein